MAAALTIFGLILAGTVACVVGIYLLCGTAIAMIAVGIFCFIAAFVFGRGYK